MKVLTVLGTRPEGIKMAPLIKALQADNDIESVFVNTAQHREMLDQVLDLFDISSDYDLNLMRPEQTPESITAEVVTALANILAKELPDVVLVHGDTTTTFAGAYASFLQQIPVGHVEAGLRTNNKYSPFPEEMNRQLVGRLSTFHFAPTERNKANLLNENIHKDQIAVVGNTVIDALLNVTSRPYQFEGHLEAIVNSGHRILLLTTHRRENLEQLKEVYTAVNHLLNENEDICVIFPVHKNPIVRKQVGRYLLQNDRVHLIEPLDYEAFVQLMKKTDLIITDSGGIQEEAPALGIPVLVARDNTERPEGVESGTLQLVGTSASIIFEAAHKLLNDAEAYKRMARAKNPYGDGTTSQQIIQFLKNQFVDKRKKQLLEGVGKA